MLNNFLIKGKKAQTRFGRLGFPSRKFEPSAVPVPRVISGQESEAQRVQEQRIAQAKIEETTALKAINKTEQSLKNRQRSLESEQGRLIEVGSRSAKIRINTIVRELLVIKQTLVRLPEARKAASAGALTSKISTFLEQTESSARAKIQGQRTVTFKQPKRLTDREIIAQAEKQAKQSLPEGVRQLIISQARAGITKIRIPTIQEVKLQQTLIPTPLKVKVKRKALPKAPSEPVEEKGILGTLGTPFISTFEFAVTPKAREALAKKREQVVKFAEKQRVVIREKGFEARDIFAPAQKELRERRERALDPILAEEQRAEADLLAFSKSIETEFLGGDFPVDVIEDLESKKISVAGIKQLKEFEERRLTAEEKAFEESPAAFASSVVASAAQTPFALADLSIGVISEPIVTIKETAKGLKALPSELETRFLPTAGELVGGTIASAALLGITPGVARLGVARLGGARGAKAGKFKVGDLEIPEAPPVARLGISLEEQAALAGKKVTAVTAAKDFFKTFGEETQIKAVPPEKLGLFFDPFGRLRSSRFRNAEFKTIENILDAEVSFARERPQAIVLRDAPVEEFPFGLKPIAQKLKRGQQLSMLEEAKLLEFQTKPSGLLKPIGRITREPEVTLAPGEILRKKEQLGTLIIEGKPVDVFSAEIRGASSETLSLVRKRGKTAKELKQLERQLERETGFDVSLSRSTKPIIRIPPLQAVSLLQKRKAPSKKVSFDQASRDLTSDITRISRPPKAPIRKAPSSIAREARTRISPAPSSLSRFPPTRIISAFTSLTPPRPPKRSTKPFALPDFDKQFKKRQRKFKKSKKEEDLFFVQSFTGKVIGKKERRTIEGFRERALNVNLASITGRPILIKRKKRKAVKKTNKKTTKKRKRK